MRKGTAVLVLALLVVPILAAPAHAWRHGGFHHGGGDELESGKVAGGPAEQVLEKAGSTLR